MDEHPDDAGPWLPPEMWDRCVDPALPPGVIEVQVDDGRRFRYPLIEFMVD